MIPRMIGDGMAGGGDRVDEVPMLRREFANHEKGCTRIISIKNFKDFRRDIWMRAVIKGEGNSWTRRIDVDVVARARATASRRANEKTLRKRKCTRNEYQYYLWQRLGNMEHSCRPSRINTGQRSKIAVCKLF